MWLSSIKLPNKHRHNLEWGNSLQARSSITSWCFQFWGFQATPGWWWRWFRLLLLDSVTVCHSIWERSRSVLFVFGTAQAHTNSFPSSVRTSAYRSVLFVFGNSLTYVPAKAKVNVGLDPERAHPGQYQRQDTVLLQSSSFPYLLWVTWVPLRYHEVVLGKALWPPRSYFHSYLPPRLSRFLCFPIPLSRCQAVTGLTLSAPLSSGAAGAIDVSAVGAVNIRRCQRCCRG